MLDIEASTRVRDYDITIGLHGTLEKLNTTYRSDPPLSSDDIVALLAFGRTQQQSAMGRYTFFSRDSPTAPPAPFSARPSIRRLRTVSRSYLESARSGSILR